jgi:hypothetical protein
VYYRQQGEKVVILLAGTGNDTLPSWVKSFFTDLAATGGMRNPNEKIKITLPEE